MLDKIMYVANRFILLYTQSHRQRETHTHTYTCLHVHTAHAHFLDWRSNYAPQRGIWMGIFLPQFLWMGSHVCAIIMPHITFFSDWSSTHPLLFLLANLLSCTVSSFFFSFSGRGLGTKIYAKWFNSYSECWFAQVALIEKLLVWWQNKLEGNAFP